MSIWLGSFVLLSLLTGVVGTVLAIAKPQLRLAMSIVALLGFVAAMSGAGFFVLIVSRMN